MVNALSYRAYRDMAEIARVVGQDADATSFSERAEALRAAINQRLYAGELGRYDDGMDGNGNLSGHHSLHASAFALAFGIPDAAEAPRVAAYLASRGMACSVYCAPFLIGGLYRAGGGQAALELLGSSGAASWLNMIRLGAGATAEAWDPSMKGNRTYSHPWAASPAFVIPSGLFGIQPLEAGYASFSLKPQPGALQHGAITVPTVRGSIGAAFDYTSGGAFRLAVHVPANTRAELSVPVVEGTTTLYLDGVAHDVQPENGYATVADVSAGCHVVSADAALDLAGDEALPSVRRPARARR